MSSSQKSVQQWHPPFTRSGAIPHHPLWLMQTLGQAKGGFYPIGKNGLLHGGVHFDQKTADYLHQHEVRALADGEVIAWRLDDQYPETLVDGNNKVFSRSFVLLRHLLEAPVIEGAGTPPKLTFYSLYMHLKSWVACQADKSALPHWQTRAIYQIKPDDSIEGLRVRSQPKGQVLGLLPRGCQVELEPLVEGETTNGWRRLKQVLDGQILPAALPESTTGWVFAGELDLETGNTYRVGTRARDQEDALMKGKGLNLRDLNQDPKNNIVGMIPQGVRFTLGEPVGQYRVITGFETGEGQPRLPSHYTGHSVHSSYLQALAPQPLQLNEVHIPEQPIPVQAGEVIGWVGQYQNLNEETPHPLMQLDVFTQDDLPGFIEQSCTWAAKLPESHQTLLKIQKDQSRIVPCAGSGILPEISQAIPAPANLLLNRQELNRLPASHQQWDSDNKGHWWLLENSLPAGSDDSTTASYWIHESLSELKPLTPWHWDGQDCLEESQQPLHYLLSQLNGLLDRSTQDLGRLLNSRSWLGNALNTALSMLPAGVPRTLRNVFEQSHPLKHYVSQLDDAQQGSLQTRLQALLDENGDGLLSPQEIQQAQQKPWQQQPLAGLAIRMDSEWKWNKAKWDSLDGLANHTVNCPNKPWAAQKERIERLSWWDEVAARSHRLGTESNVWHMHPATLYNAFGRSVPNLAVARIRAYMRMIRVGEGTVGETGYERLFGGSSFIRDHGRTFDDHPEIVISRSGYHSSAAGAYQVITKTWNDSQMVRYKKIYGVSGFTPRDQDIFCLILLKYKQSNNDVNRNPIQRIVAGDIEWVTENVYSWEWASLPPGKYGQPIKSMEEVLRFFDRYLDQEVRGITDLHIENSFIESFVGE